MNDPVAQDCVENIKSAKSPEEAARIGRSMQRKRPDLVLPSRISQPIDISMEYYFSNVFIA